MRWWGRLIKIICIGITTLVLVPTLITGIMMDQFVPRLVGLACAILFWIGFWFGWERLSRWVVDRPVTQSGKTTRARPR